MRKFLVAAAAAVVSLSAAAMPPYIFDHLGANLSLGTTGIGVELTTPITQWVTMRAGVAIMPNFSFSTEVDAEVDARNGIKNETVNAKIGMGRVQGDIIFNVYPAPQLMALYVAAGAYFGGNNILTVKGHSDLAAQYGGSVNIADNTLPFNDKGDFEGGFKLNGFRPYLGIGYGRALPKGRLAFNIELGVQFEGQPKVYTKYGKLNQLSPDAESSLNDITKYFKVYPVLSFKLAGRIF